MPWQARGYRQVYPYRVAITSFYSHEGALGASGVSCGSLLLKFSRCLMAGGKRRIKKNFTNEGVLPIMRQK